MALEYARRLDAEIHHDRDSLPSDHVAAAVRGRRNRVELRAQCWAEHKRLGESVTVFIHEGKGKFRHAPD